MREAPRPPEGEAWKSLYTAALFESDLTKLSKRIAEAEQALVLRAGELFHATGDHIEEEEALNKAMYSLNALRNAYECRSLECSAQRRRLERILSSAGPGTGQNESVPDSF